LPSGRLVRGRGLSRPLPDGPEPALALYLLGRQPPPVAWESRWLRWPDFGLPSDRPAMVEALREAWARAETERVEIACAGGHGPPGRRWPASPYSTGAQRRGGRVRAGALLAPGRRDTWQRRFVGRFPSASARRITIRERTHGSAGKSPSSCEWTPVRSRLGDHARPGSGQIVEDHPAGGRPRRCLAGHAGRAARSVDRPSAAVPICRC